MNGFPTLKVVRTSQFAKIPTKASSKSAGLDLYSAYDYYIPSFGKQLCATDIIVAVPDGCYGRIAPRSGLAFKHFLDVGAGVIDGDYRGPISVLIFNFATEEFLIKRGDRIAQLICEYYCAPVVQECTKLENTERGSDGFGSSGIN